MECLRVKQEGKWDEGITSQKKKKNASEIIISKVLQACIKHLNATMLKMADVSLTAKSKHHKGLLTVQHLPQQMEKKLG